MSGAALVRRVIVGTAGHIDHGKTTLVERLTGIRTDRLPEEQARGMTIEVGYAELSLPDGTEVGLLDVPGHERLVRTMVAAATSMDLVVLVVAADDGIMPQTREHIDVLDLLGVERGLVVLTKIDLVDAARVQAVQGEVRAALQGTRLAEAPIHPVSCTTGVGLPALREALAAELAAQASHPDDGRSFRMWAMRSFVAAGRGTVVTGIPCAGRLAVGDEVEILPLGARCRVRGLHVHHRPADAAQRATRCALLLADAPEARIERGMVVAAAGQHADTPWASARVRLLGHVRRPLRHATTVRMHVGSADVMVRVHLLGAAEITPGRVAAVHLQALEPMCVAPGDRFLLRAENAEDTLGGGLVVRRRAERPRRPGPHDVRELLAQAERLDVPVEVLRDVLVSRGPRGGDLPTLVVESGLTPATVEACAGELVREARAVRRGRGILWDARAFEAVERRLLETLEGLHLRRPGAPFVPLSEVRAGLLGLPTYAVEAALESLADPAPPQGSRLRMDGRGGVASATAPDALLPAQRERLAKVLDALRAGAEAPPGERELAVALDMRPADVREALHVLQARGEAFRAAEICFDAGWVRTARERLAALARDVGPFSPSQACKALGSSRKYVLPLLEALDRAGFTRRSGGVRSLRAPGPT